MLFLTTFKIYHIYIIFSCDTMSSYPYTMVESVGYCVAIIVMLRKFMYILERIVHTQTRSTFWEKTTTFFKRSTYLLSPTLTSQPGLGTGRLISQFCLKLNNYMRVYIIQFSTVCRFICYFLYSFSNCYVAVCVLHKILFLCPVCSYIVFKFAFATVVFSMLHNFCITIQSNPWYRSLNCTPFVLCICNRFMVYCIISV